MSFLPPLRRLNEYSRLPGQRTQQPTTQEKEKLFNFVTVSDTEFELRFESPKQQQISHKFQKSVQIVDIFLFLEQNSEFDDIRIICDDHVITLDHPMSYLQKLTRSYDIHVHINNTTRYTLDYDNSALQGARERMRSKDYKGALLYFNKAVERDPKNPGILLSRSHCLFHLEKYRAGLNDARDANHIYTEQSLSDVVLLSRILRSRMKCAVHLFQGLESSQKLKEGSSDYLKEAFSVGREFMKLNPGDASVLEDMYEIMNIYVRLSITSPTCLLCRQRDCTSLHAVIPEELVDMIGKGRVKSKDCFVCDDCLTRWDVFDEYFINNVWMHYNEGTNEDGSPVKNREIEFSNDGDVPVNQLYYFCLYTVWKGMMKKNINDMNSPGNWYTIFESLRLIMLHLRDPIFPIYLWIDDYAPSYRYDLEIFEENSYSVIRVYLGAFQIYLVTHDDNTGYFDPKLLIYPNSDSFTMPHRNVRRMLEPMCDEETDDDDAINLEELDHEDDDDDRYAKRPHLEDTQRFFGKRYE